MTEEERQNIIDKLNGLSGDNEQSHFDADTFLLEALRLAGYNDIASAWLAASERIEFWYA